MVDTSTEPPETLIVVARELASFYEFLKPRQEARGRDSFVLLDRRVAERRETTETVARERRRRERRATDEAGRALMSVLGFTILHRNGERYTA